LATRHALVAITLVVVAAGAAGMGIADAVSHSSGASHSTYGALPSYLPTSSLRNDSTLVGSAAHPALTSQGDSVRTELPHGDVVATVTGPEVPGEGLPYQGNATTATWTVTLSHATTSVPIELSDFSTIDSLGKTYHLNYVPGQRQPPAVLRAGASTRFELRAVMRIGEGMMRWAPVHRNLLATWDFVVEND
jgi:hypothetical protein